jgi:hypothetical protein
MYALELKASFIDKSPKRKEYVGLAAGGKP